MLLAEQVGNGPSARISFGTHRLPGWAVEHSCADSWPCSFAGIELVGTQRARLLQHAANVFAGCVGPASHEILHAPVGWPSIGLKQGVHFSVAAQVSRGSRSACAWTAGSTADRQRPSAPFTDVHVGAVNLPPVRRNTSGTHSFVPSVHLPSCAACAGSVMKLGSMQWASGPHAVRVDGSMTAG